MPRQMSSPPSTRGHTQKSFALASPANSACPLDMGLARMTSAYDRVLMVGCSSAFGMAEPSSPARRSDLRRSSQATLMPSTSLSVSAKRRPNAIACGRHSTRPNHAIDVNAAGKPRDIEAGRRQGLSPRLFGDILRGGDFLTRAMKQVSAWLRRGRACSRQAGHLARPNPKPTGRAGRHAHGYLRRTADIVRPFVHLLSGRVCRRSRGIANNTSIPVGILFCSIMGGPMSILRRAWVSAIHSPAVLALISELLRDRRRADTGTKGASVICRRNASRFLRVRNSVQQ